MERIKKKMKPLAGNLITLAIVCVLFAAVFILVETGHATRHMRAMLVPICINIILAVSLNLTVGFLGELTLGHAGFMSVGAYAGCLFSIAMKDILPMAARFPGSPCSWAALWQRFSAYSSAFRCCACTATTLPS